MSTTANSVTSAPRGAIALVFVLAFATRALGSERYVTVDEAIHWTPRVEAFASALADGRLADTAVAPHPGVVTLWCGATGQWLHRGAVATGIASDEPESSRWWLRLPAKLVTAACPAIAAWALARVFGARIAVLAGLLWAADPFVLAHSRILHVDALGASLAGLCIVLVLAAVAHGCDRRWLIGAGITAGLAAVTRLPTGLVAPWALIAIAVCVPTWRERARALAILAGAAIVTFVVAWPAMWVDPIGAITKLGQGVGLGAQVHEHGNFFLGEPLEDPGLAFYAVAVPLRLAPWVMLALPVDLLRRDRYTEHRRPRLLLWAWIVLLGVVLALFGKKFDRYALALFPIFDVLAAVGLVAAMQWLSGRMRRPIVLPSIVVAVLLAVDGWWWHPYPLARYNPLVGGGAVAARSILVGWGEGLDLVGDEIRKLTDDCSLRIAAKEIKLLQAVTCQRVVTLDRAAKADFVVGYVKDLQRDDRRLARFVDEPPAAIVVLHGIEYARIWDRRETKRR